MRIKVTRRHILEGIGRRSSECPIAFAIADQTTIPEPVVLGRTLYFERPKNLIELGERHRWKYPHAVLPQQCERFQLHFDRGEEVKPFEFEVDIPTQFMKQQTEQEDPAEVDGAFLLSDSYCGLASIANRPTSCSTSLCN